MKATFLLISDNAALRTRLRELLRMTFTDAEVNEHDPVKEGWLGEDVDWRCHNLVFLDYGIEGDSGMDWFKVLRARQGFPAAVIFSGQADPEIAVKAIKAGAENYLACNSMNAEKLRAMITEILPELESRDVPSAANEPATKPKEKPQKPQSGSRVIRLPAKKSVVGRWPSIEGYKMIKQIGRGGMSTVYLAERGTDNRTVVIKMLSAALVDNKKSVIRSNQEFKLISRIDNPHIVRLYEHGTLGEVMYTVMEYFPGGDLKQRLREGGVDQGKALSCLYQIAKGLNAIHGCGIIHRDLKPGNIMFREDGSLAIIDFGISKDINSSLDLTNPDQVMGTPNYMAPEQGKGLCKPDARSDLYSLGVMLYEMLTGKKPYAASTGAAIIYKHLHDPVPQLPNRYYELQAVIDKTMAKFPQQRFNSAYDLLQFLDNDLRMDLLLGPVHTF